MAGVCFTAEKRTWQQDQWSWVFSNFGITEIWQRGSTDDAVQKIYQPVTLIASVAELPPDRAVVVMSPKDSRYLPGTKSLVDFEHPDDPIYLFGASFGSLSHDDLGDRHAAVVYIPTVKCELYSFAAGYITLYDRLVKRGRRNG